jgi:hypothetical protein
MLVKEDCHSINNTCEMCFIAFHLFKEFLNKYQEGNTWNGKDRPGFIQRGRDVAA